MITPPLRYIHRSILLSSSVKCLLRAAEHVQNHGILIQRHVHATYKKNNFWEPNKRGTTDYDKEDPFTRRQHIIRGSKMLIPEARKWIAEMKEYFSPDFTKAHFPQEEVIDKYFEFNGPDSLQNWVVSADSDVGGGFSTAEVSISPYGTGLFTGNLSSQVPKTGKIENTGFVNLRYVPPLKSWLRDPTYVFVNYTHLVLRIRGDGRSYMLNLHTHNFFDITWLNLHSYVLYTRGGPYWQLTMIPFTKFLFSYKGRVQGDQRPIDLSEIKNISITLADKNHGPFSLEIDYIGCLYDPNFNTGFAYEQYYVPPYTGKN